MSFDKSLSAAVFMHQVTKANTQVTTSQRQIHKSLLYEKCLLFNYIQITSSTIVKTLESNTKYK